MNRMHASNFIACGAGLAALGLCAAATAAPEPCKLLTPQQVSAAVGMHLAAGSAIGSTGCDWAGPAGSKVRVTLALWPGSGWAKMKAPLPHITKTPLSGVGDDAFYAVMGPFTSLSVEKGDTAFILKVYGIPDSQQQLAIEKTLAASVITQL
jgi:hypothetical protein